METGSTNTDLRPRVDYIDWLRVITTLCVFVFHSARFFDRFSGWHVKNNVTWIGGDIIVAFMSMWIMPMFMVLAGASTCYALRVRSPGEYAGERVLRLLVPFLFGILVIVVPQTYYELQFRNSLPCSFLPQCYLLYLLDLPQRFAGFGFYHLWFLIVLFVFSLVCLPLFLDLFKRGSSPLGALSARCSSPWQLALLLILPLVLVNILVPPATLWGSRDFGGWCLAAHLLFFLSGYIIFSGTDPAGLLRKLGRPAAAAAVLAGMALMPVVDILANLKDNYGTVLYALAQVVEVVLCWGLMICIINLVMHFLNYRNRFLAYASEAVLPFYILHQTVIIVTGFYIVQWDHDPALKYLAIALLSFSLIMALYELLIKRINVLRFLFGMRLRRKA